MIWHDLASFGMKWHRFPRGIGLLFARQALAPGFPSK
jgi:hypothetical protein